MNINIQNLYKQVLENTLSKTQFLYEVRRNVVLNNYINNTMCYDDVVNVFKSKGFITNTITENAEDNFDFKKSFHNLSESVIVNEAKSKTLDIDHVNFYEFTKGWKLELEKTDDIDKAKEAALKNLTKDSMFYTRQEMEKFQKEKKKRTDLPKEYTKATAVDKDNAVKPVPGKKKPTKDSTKKIDPKASKKPVGVKQLKGDPGPLVVKKLNEAVENNVDIEEFKKEFLGRLKSFISDEGRGKHNNDKGAYFELEIPTNKIYDKSSKKMLQKIAVLMGLDISKMSYSDKDGDSTLFGPFGGYDIDINHIQDEYGDGDNENVYIDIDVKLRDYEGISNKGISINMNEAVDVSSIAQYLISLGVMGVWVKAMMGPDYFKDMDNEEKGEAVHDLIDKAKIDDNKKKSIWDKVKSKFGFKDDNLVEAKQKSKGTWNGSGEYTVSIKTVGNMSKNKTVNIASKEDFEKVKTVKDVTGIVKKGKEKSTEDNTKLYIWRRKDGNNDNWGQLTDNEYESLNKSGEMSFIKPTTQAELDKRKAHNISQEAKPEKTSVKSTNKTVDYSAAPKGDTYIVIIKKGPGANNDEKKMTKSEIDKWKQKNGSASVKIIRDPTQILDKTKTSTTSQVPLNKTSNSTSGKKENEPSFDVDSKGVKQIKPSNKPTSTDGYSWALYNPIEKKVIKLYKSGEKEQAKKDQISNKSSELLQAIHPKVKSALQEDVKPSLDKYKGQELSFTIRKLDQKVSVSGLYLKSVTKPQNQKYEHQINLIEIDKTTSVKKDAGYVMTQKSHAGISSIYNDAGNLYKVLSFDKEFDKIVKELYNVNQPEKDDRIKETVTNIFIKKLQEFINSPVKSGPVVKLEELKRISRSFVQDELESQDPGKRKRASENFEKIKDMINEIKFNKDQLNESQLEEFNSIVKSLKLDINESEKNNHIKEVESMAKMKPSDAVDYITKNIDLWNKHSIKIKAAAQILAHHMKNDPNNNKIKDAFLKVTNKTK